MSFALVHQSNKNKQVEGKASTSHSKHSSHKSNTLARGSNDSIISSQRSIGDQAVHRLMHSAEGFDFTKISILQPNLKVSKSGDAYEQEADRVAEQVLSMPMSDSIAPKNTSKERGIDRKCSACEMAKGDKEDEKLDVNRKPSSTSSLETTNKIANKINMIHSDAGMPLDLVIRRFMEPRIGHDFSKVRIHIDSKAAESARLVGAQAYTVGSDIVFGLGQFSPHTSYGRRLLAHELTHVVQQFKGITQGIQRQPAVAAQPSIVVQPSFADIDRDLLINLQGEEDAREIVTRGFGGENNLNNLFKSMAEVQKQVDADAARDGAKLSKTMANINWAKDLKTLYYAQFLVRMRRYFGSWPALLDHFKDITELSGSPGHFLHKSAATRLEHVLEILKRKSIRSLSNAFSLRGRYYGDVQAAGQMTHAMGYALDIAASTNPALKKKDEGLQKSDTLHIAAIIGGSPRMDLEPDLAKSKSGFIADKYYGRNYAFIESMGSTTASAANPQSAAEASISDSKTKEYFAIFEKEFRKMEDISKKIQISISPANQSKLLELRRDHFDILMSLERMRNLLKIEGKKQSKIDELKKQITDLEDRRIKKLNETPKFMTEWIAAIDAYIAREEPVLKQSGLDMLRAPSVVSGDIKNIDKEVTKARKKVVDAQSAVAIAETELKKHKLDRFKAMDSHILLGNAKQELDRVTSSRVALADELKKSKLGAPKDRELLEKWENVTLLREHRKWLTTPNLKTPTDVDDYERLIFGNLRETKTPKDLKQAGLKPQERLVNNPPLVRLATEGFMTQIPGDFDLDFFKEMAHWGFWPGATWRDPIDTMHFELIEGRKSIKHP